MPERSTGARCAWGGLCPRDDRSINSCSSIPRASPAWRHPCAGHPSRLKRRGRVPAERYAGGRASDRALSWIAQADDRGQARYQLRFRVPGRGVLIQVPFPPYNLRWFDDEGAPLPWPISPACKSGRSRRLPARWRFSTAASALPRTTSDRRLPLRTPPRPRRPFLYPVNGPDGIGLTEFGKPHDPTGSHAHHYSIWVSHAGVNGTDFWSERRGSIIAHDSVELLEDGPVFCRLAHKARWMATLDPKAKPVMNDKRTLTFYRGEPDFRLIDVELEFAPVGSEPVTLGQTNFGFLAVRVAQSMTVFDGGGEIMNSAGDRNEQQGASEAGDLDRPSGPRGREPLGGRGDLRPSRQPATSHLLALSQRRLGRSGFQRPIALHAPPRRGPAPALPRLPAPRQRPGIAHRRPLRRIRRPRRLPSRRGAPRIADAENRAASTVCRCR